MLNVLLNQVDIEKYEFAVFACTSIGCPVIADYLLLEGGCNPYDEYGGKQLVNFLDKNKFDIVCFVGLDVWRYSKVYPELISLKNRDKFKWVSIFPYDAINIRQDWLTLFSPIDVPCVYSEYGFSLLKETIPNLLYFRPSLYDAEKFVPFSEEKRNDIRQKLFQNHGLEEKFIFGFFGNNQIRKDPLRLIKAFFEVHKEFSKTSLYLHTNLEQGVYNIEQYIRDCGGKIGDILIKKQKHDYTTKSIVEAYNAIDCYVNVSLQEGLSWTVLEAMLCDVPVIAAHNTAHIELLSEGAGIGVPSSEIAYLPVLAANGASTFIESRACNYASLVYVMKSVMDKNIRNNLREKGIQKAKKWLESVSNINDILNIEIVQTPVKITTKEKINKVLFAQHSSAGDVFMTTRCFKDIKKRHPDIPLVYMTQKKYQNIVEDNPFIDTIIYWDSGNFKNYKYFYNSNYYYF